MYRKQTITIGLLILLLPAIVWANVLLRRRAIDCNTTSSTTTSCPDTDFACAGDRSLGWHADENTLDVTEEDGGNEGCSAGCSDGDTTASLTGAQLVDEVGLLISSNKVAEYAHFDAASIFEPLNGSIEFDLEVVAYDAVKQTNLACLDMADGKWMLFYLQAAKTSTTMEISFMIYDGVFSAVTTDDAAFDVGEFYTIRGSWDYNSAGNNMWIAIYDDEMALQGEKRKSDAFSIAVAEDVYFGDFFGGYAVNNYYLRDMQLFIGEDYFGQLDP